MIYEIYNTREQGEFENLKLFHVLLDDLLPSLVNERKLVVLQ